MARIEVRAVTPDELARELEINIQKTREDKYAFQVGLKDLDFDVDDNQLQVMGLSLPFADIDHAEQALNTRVMRPITFLEHDETKHQVLIFDPRPVGFSGFMDCVTHSLALTDQGLFEVGRYPAVDLVGQSRYWGWFIHRCLMKPEQVTAVQTDQSLTSDQFIEQVYTAMTRRE